MLHCVYSVWKPQIFIQAYRLLSKMTSNVQKRECDICFLTGIYAIQDTLTNTKRKLAESVQCWNCR